MAKVFFDNKIRSLFRNARSVCKRMRRFGGSTRSGARIEAQVFGGRLVWGSHPDLIPPQPRRTGPDSCGGMALVLALVAVLLISVLIGGLMSLSVSHYALSNTNSDYANALMLAEAGINYELNKISKDALTADTTPFTTEYPTGSGRTFEVYVVDYLTGGTWTPPNDMWVISKGTVDGLSRTVRVRARAHSLFGGDEGTYALFGINSLSTGGTFGVVGASGTNGDLAITGSGADVVFVGDFSYCGPDASGDDATTILADGYSAQTTVLPEAFPTINTLAEARAAFVYPEYYPDPTLSGIEFFSAHNTNNSIIVQDNDGNQWLSTNTSTVLNDFFEGEKTIILPAGDYYFSDVSVNAKTILVDNTGGPVNIWLDSDSTKKMTLNGNLSATSTDPSNFNLYVSTLGEFLYDGTATLYGNIYAYNEVIDPTTGAVTYVSSVSIIGTGDIYGSVIAYDVAKASGTGKIVLPSTGGTGPPGPDDPILFYGFDYEWEELDPA